MKFDKETIIVLAIAVAILIGWSLYYPKYQAQQAQKLALQEQEQRANAAAKAAQQTVQTPAPAPVTAAPAAVPATSAEPIKAVPAVAVSDLKPVTAVLENELVKVTVNALDGTIADVELKQFRKNIGSEDHLVLRPEGKEIRTMSTDLFSGTPTAQPEVKMDAAANTLTIARLLPGFRVVETFTLPKDSYETTIHYTVTNTSAEDKLIPQVTFWASGMPPMQYLSSDKVNTQRHNIDFCLDKKQTVKSFEPDPKKPEKLADNETSEPVTWAGSTNKYFASLLFPVDGKFNNGIKLSQTVAEANGSKYAIPSVGGSVKNVSLPKGASFTQTFRYYCGPKELKRIDALPETAMDAMHIAYWSWFEFIARPLARFLVWLYGIVGNYGIAIILLTVIVRLVFWPVTQKANTSMRKMQKIQPIMKELREKYKDNPTELNMRMMELYKTEKVNPLGGCLPMLLQLPIFFALYSVFDSAVELRHVSFLWAKDLAQPDQVGPVLNLLGFQLAIHPWILMMTALMIVQQKMTPAQGDPMQRKMMMAMPVIMLVMLYWLPSGLTLYWTVSQLFSIIQLKYGQYLAAKEEAQEKSSGNHPKTAKAK